ncbi:MAG: LytR C-terminal domain-containing protein [Acidimicrobiales bacterium]
MSIAPEQPAGRRTGPPDVPSGFPAGRAVLLLAGFIIVAVLLLGLVHPSSTSPTTAAPTATPVSTHRAPVNSTTTTTTIPASKVVVLVANASTVNNAATAVTNLLQPGGWHLLAPVNATGILNASQVYFLNGQQQPADAIAAALHLPSSAVIPYTTAAPISTVGSAQVVVAVAAGLGNRAITPTTTTTTTRPATTTRPSTSSKHSG